jgi:hypothetical protein
MAVDGYVQTQSALSSLPADDLPAVTLAKAEVGGLPSRA